MPPHVPFPEGCSLSRRKLKPADYRWTVQDVLDLDGEFLVGGPQLCHLRWVTIVRTFTSWGSATLSFDQYPRGNHNPECLLKCYYRRSRKPFSISKLAPMPLLIKELETWEVLMAFELRKREADGSLPKAKDDFIDPFFAKHATAVGQVVFQAAYPDGMARKPGFFACWRSPDGVTVKVTDNEVEMCWQYSADSFLEALGQLEKALQKGLPGNRSYETRSGRKKGK